MKVLLLSLHHPELVRGGAQQVAYELFEGLKEVSWRGAGIAGGDRPYIPGFV